MNLTAEDIRLYAFCPRAFQLRAEGSEKKATFGSVKARVARKVIEKHNISNFESIWAYETEPIDEKEKSKKITRKETKEQKEKARLLEQLTNFVAIENNEAMGKNIRYEVKLLDFVFYGYIDQLRFNPNGGELTLWQFNTSSQAPPEQFLQRDFFISMACYASWKGKLFAKNGNELAINTIPDYYVYYLPNLELRKKKTKDGEKGDLKGNPLLPAFRTEKFLLDFEFELLQIAELIRARYFPMLPAHPRCNLCSYSKDCKSSLISRTEKEIETF